MSIILKRECEGRDPEKLCLTKCADNIMAPLLASSHSTFEHQRLKEYPCLGLRTLVVASKFLSPTQGVPPAVEVRQCGSVPPVACPLQW